MAYWRVRSEPDLGKWIDEASKGLEPLAREKITEQITEHYEDSVAGYHSSGLSEIKACSRVIVDLGKPSFARKKYKKIYLSLNASIQLEKYINSIESNAFLYRYFAIASYIYAILQIGWSLETRDRLDNYQFVSFLAVFIIYSFYHFKLKKEKFTIDYEIGLKYLINSFLFYGILFSTMITLISRRLNLVESIDFLKAQNPLDQARAQGFWGNFGSALIALVVLVWSILFINLLMRRARALSQ